MKFLKHHLPAIIFLFAVSLVFNGCDSQPVPGLPPTEAMTKLVDIAKNDYKIDLKLKQVDTTLWIYVATDDSFFDIKASKQGPSFTKDTTESPEIRFLETRFDNESQTFIIEYDIGVKKSYDQDFGYQSIYTKAYSSIQRNILTSVQRAFANVEKNPINIDADGAIVNNTDQTIQTESETTPTPEFFIIVIANTEKGIKTTMTMAFDDILRVSRDMFFMEEYIRRAIIDPPMGSEDIIDDTSGDHIDYTPLDWPQFLAKQMRYRIQFKYQRSRFEPESDPIEELFTTATKTLAAYEYRDFQHVKLIDITSDQAIILDYDGIIERMTNVEPPEKQYHVIQLDNIKEFMEYNARQKNQTATEASTP